MNIHIHMYTGITLDILTYDFNRRYYHLYRMSLYINIYINVYINTGITLEILERTVLIGDIIISIGSRNVQSAKFSDILDLLRSMKNSTRTIEFKNVSTSCKLYAYRDTSYVRHFIHSI
jgi:hypothetical protein